MARRAIEWLRGEGVTDLAVNLHHLPDAVTGVLGDGRALGVQIRYSREPELRGTAGAVDALRAWLAGERFLVMYADNVVECRLGELEVDLANVRVENHKAPQAHRRRLGHAQQLRNLARHVLVDARLARETPAALDLLSFSEGDGPQS